MSQLTKLHVLLTQVTHFEQDFIAVKLNIFTNVLLNYYWIVKKRKQLTKQPMRYLRTVYSYMYSCINSVEEFN